MLQTLFVVVDRESDGFDTIKSSWDTEQRGGSLGKILRINMTTRIAPARSSQETLEEEMGGRPDI